MLSALPDTVDDQVRNILLQHSLVDTLVREIVSYIRHVQTVYGLRHDHRELIDVGNLELSLVDTFLKDVAE